MRNLLVAVIAFSFSAGDGLFADELLTGIANPVHGYWTRPTNDRFARLKRAMERGEVTLAIDNDRAFLADLLARLEVPVSSQLLVSSTTSLQKRWIRPSNPRALYFNEDTYVGYVPHGQVEVASLDPDVGSVFYYFDAFRKGRMPAVTREENCMNCHTPHYLGGIPALVIESVVPGMTGGGEKAFRRERTGHGVPLDDRLGGWIVTGAPDALRHWGNIIMEYDAAGRHERKIAPGELFDFARYLAPTSDILPHLLHEHQVGFVNRALVAAYRYRERIPLSESPPRSQPATDGKVRLLDELAAPVVEYLLFADEVSLPSGGIVGDAAFKTGFLANKRTTSTGLSLKDFDLRERLFKNRCSYMIYSPAFAGLPKELKERVFAQLQDALRDDAPGPPAKFAYLPVDERRGIRNILNETLKDFAIAADAEPGNTVARAVR